MSHFAPIFALGWNELFTVVVFVIVVLSSVISQFLNKQKQGERPQRPQRGPVPGEPVAMGGNQPRKPRAEALGDEIGDFLRRAAQGGQRPAQGGQRPAQARPVQGGMPPRPVQPRPAQVRSSRPRAPVPRRAQAPVQAEIIEPARPPVGQGLSQQVDRDINTSDIARHASGLGAETRQATTKLDKRVHESFDRQLGSLSQKSKTPAEEPQTGPDDALPITSAAGLGALLGDAESLKQAIILNEILQRPAQRW